MDIRAVRRCAAVVFVLLVAALLPIAPASAASVDSSSATSSGAVAAQGTVPFTPSPCPIAAIEGLRVDCGYLTVAESRRNYTGKTIELAVAIVRSPNPAPAAEPMVFLSGGPGQGALYLAPVLAQAFSATLLQRDLVLIDQRGTGFSRPSLTCTYDFTTLNGNIPITASQESERTVIIQSQLASLIRCGEAYRQAGIDLRAYNSVENAADLEDLRLALGYGAWNVYGGSYGSRLALTAMQYRPDTLRSVVLESIYPPTANFHTDVFSSFNRSLNELFNACATDAACNTAYPNLGTTYDAMIARLNAETPSIPIINPVDDTVITYLPISGVDVGQILFQLFYSTPDISVLPALIDETADGNYRLLSALFGLLLTQSAQPGSFSLGMQVAVQCNEDVSYASAEDFVRARDANRRAAPLAHTITFNEALLEVCAAWGLATPEAGSDVQVSSNVRAFVIGGQFDPITPPQYTTDALTTLPNTVRVEYPRGGHTPSLSSPCLIVATAAFFANPAATPDTSCIAQEAPIPFAILQ